MSPFSTTSIASILLLTAIFAAPSAEAQQASTPLKVFVLAGQSNMDGHARISSFDHVGMDPNTAPILARMRAEDGTPRVCEQVWISYFRSPEEGGEGSGKLTTGYGSRRDPAQAGDKIGPEFTFGIYMQELLDEPILIIKTAWGGKSLHTDFRPPSAGPYEFNEQQLEAFRKRDADLEQIKAERVAATGRFYRLMIDHVRGVLNDPGRVCPSYDPEQGVELAGFVWFQGWNDMVDRGTYPNRSEPGGYALYSDLLTHFIRDVRKDLAAPEMHFVIGVLGVGGPVERYGADQQRYKSTHQEFRNAMAAPARRPEFQGNVTAVLTENFWDPELDEVLKKKRQWDQKAKELKKANEGYPEQAESLSPEAQIEILDRYHEELFTPRDALLLTGVTNAAYHYLGSAKIMAQIGKAFAEAMYAGIRD